MWPLVLCTLLGSVPTERHCSVQAIAFFVIWVGKPFRVVLVTQAFWCCWHTFLIECDFGWYFTHISPFVFSSPPTLFWFHAHGLNDIHKIVFLRLVLSSLVAIRVFYCEFTKFIVLSFKEYFGFLWLTARIPVVISLTVPFQELVTIVVFFFVFLHPLFVFGMHDGC